MKKRDYRDYLQDMLDSINDVESFTENMTFDSFRGDRKTMYAVIRCIEVLNVKILWETVREDIPSLIEPAARASGQHIG